MSEDTAALSEVPPEPETDPGRRRALVAVVASVVAVVLIAGGGFAAWQFFSSGGPRPAEVLPSSTFALVTVDLDPSGSQKIEAIKTLRRLPSWRKRVGLTTDSDLVKAVFEKTVGKGACKSLDYEQDVKPWVGSRAGLGGVLLGDGKAAPVLALQVKDPDQAKAGFAKLVDCTGADHIGWTTTEDYVLASDSTSHAKAIAAAGKDAPLAESSDFQKWTEKVGGPGILNAYVGRTSIQVLGDNLKSGLGFGLGSGLGSGPSSGLGSGTGSGLGGLSEGSMVQSSFAQGSDNELADSMKGFKGAAAALRFADGGIELSVAGGGTKRLKSHAVGDHVGALPQDTAAVLAVSVPEDALKRLKGSDPQTPFSPGEMLGGLFGAGSGLDLPDDLITLLGSSLSLSLGGDAPADLKGVSDPGDLPVGALVHGDEDKIRAVIDKVETHTGAHLSDLPATVASSDGKVAIASTSSYADQLLGNGSLGSSEDFKAVVAHADEAQAILYVSLDNDWTTALRGLAADQDDPEAGEVVDNLAALRALGASVWSHGDTGYARIRLALR